MGRATLSRGCGCGAISGGAWLRSERARLWQQRTPRAAVSRLPRSNTCFRKVQKIRETAIASAAHWQDPKLVAEWIDRGADVNAAEGSYKRTALMTAAASEQAGAPMVKMLLEKGADPNAEDIDGERPLDWAIYQETITIRSALLEKFRSQARAWTQGRKRMHRPKRVASPIRGFPAERAVNLLPAIGSHLIRCKRGCIPCHGEAIVAVAAAAAREKGLAIHEELEQDNLKQMEASYKLFGELAMQGDQPGGNIVTIGYVMMGFDAGKSTGWIRSPRKCCILTLALAIVRRHVDTEWCFASAARGYVGDGYRHGHPVADCRLGAGLSEGCRDSSCTRSSMATEEGRPIGRGSRDEADGTEMERLYG